MSLQELIKILENTAKVHPHAEIICAYGTDGKLSNDVGVHIKDNRIIIKGERS